MTKTPQIDALPGMTPLGFARSWAPEVLADSSGKWTGNALRFATKKEAEDYLADLSFRWWSVRDMRVVKSHEPVNYAWRDAKLVEVK